MPRKATSENPHSVQERDRRARRRAEDREAYLAAQAARQLEFRAKQAAPSLVPVVEQVITLAAEGATAEEIALTLARAGVRRRLGQARSE
jgi:hypothetical protein